jgi:hypothetical protein
MAMFPCDSCTGKYNNSVGARWPIRWSLVIKRTNRSQSVGLASSVLDALGSLKRAILTVFKRRDRY